MPLLNKLKRVAHAPGIRRIALDPRVWGVAHKVAAARFFAGALETTSPVRLVAREVARPGKVYTYRTRKGMPIVIQHGRDLEAFYEIFRRGEYSPPSELAQRWGNGGPRQILDVGGNVGMFSAWAAQRWPEAHIVAFEPIASNVLVFREWLRASGAHVDLIAKAVGVAPGIVRLMDRGSGSRVVPGSGPRESVEVVDLFGWLPNADLAKIDIEGAEWELLADSRLADCRTTLVLEYHPIGAPALPARREAIALLEAAGYRTGYGSQNYWGHGTLWAWRD